MAENINNRTDSATIKCAHPECEIYVSRDEACWNCGEYRCPEHNTGYIQEPDRVVFNSDAVCFLDDKGAICPICSKNQLPTIDGTSKADKFDAEVEINSLKESMLNTPRRKKYFYLLKQRIENICLKIDSLESPLEEDIFAELINKNLDNYYEPQVNIFDKTEKFICRADFASLLLKIAIFTDGRSYHSTPEQIAKDRYQEEKLTELGWSFFRYWTEEVKDRANEISIEIYQETYKKLHDIESNVVKTDKE